MTFALTYLAVLGPACRSLAQTAPPGPAVLLERLHSQNDRERRAALVTVAQQVPQSEAIVIALEELVTQRRSEEDRSLALQALGRYGAFAKRSFSVVFRALTYPDDEDWSIRSTAAQSLAALVDSPTELLPHLRDTDQEQVRWGLIFAIGCMSSPDGEVVAPLLDFIAQREDPGDRVCDAVGFTLSRLARRDKVAVVRAITHRLSALPTPPLTPTIVALRSLRLICSPEDGAEVHDTLSPLLLAYLQHINIDLAEAAAAVCNSANHAPPALVTACLMRIGTHDCARYGSELIQLAATFAPNADTVHNALLWTITSCDDSLSGTAIESVEKLSDRFIPRLQAATAASVTPILQQRYLKCVSRIGHRAHPLLPFILASLRSTDGPVISAAIDAASALGPHALLLLHPLCDLASNSRAAIRSSSQPKSIPFLTRCGILLRSFVQNGAFSSFFLFRWSQWR